MKHLFIIALLALLAASCSDTHFTYSEPVATSSTASLDEEVNAEAVDSEEASVAEPISVGGAFLRCSYREEVQDGIHELGCDIQNSNEQSLSQLGSLEVKLSNGQNIDFLVAGTDEFLPIRLTLPAAVLALDNVSIEMTLKIGEAAPLELSITMMDIENRPTENTLSGFASYVALFATPPAPGSTGQLRLTTDTCLESSNIPFSGGTKVLFKPCDETVASQQFDLVLMPDNSFLVSQQSQSSCIDIPFEFGAYVPQVNFYNDCHGGVNQRFKVIDNFGFTSLVSLTDESLCLAYDGTQDLLIKPCFGETK